MLINYNNIIFFCWKLNEKIDYLYLKNIKYIY